MPKTDLDRGVSVDLSKPMPAGAGEWGPGRRASGISIGRDVAEEHHVAVRRHSATGGRCQLLRVGGSMQSAAVGTTQAVMVGSLPVEIATHAPRPTFTMGSMRFG